MDFRITEGFRVEGTTASVPFVELAEEELLEAQRELNSVAEARGLWVPAGAGSLVVAETVDAPSIHDQLLNSLNEGVALYKGAVRDINIGRKTDDRIPLPVRAGEYRERAEDWLTIDRLAAAEQLPVSEDRPLLLLPRLNRAITTTEVVDSWKSAAEGNLWSWSERMKFLSSWTADQLSGFDPELEDEIPFEVLPTAYDELREGTVSKQKANLEALQAANPELDAATIFEGAVLARRYIGKPRRWQDSYVRGITLTPARVDRNDYVPSARVYDDGDANVYGSGVDDVHAARLRVR